MRLKPWHGPALEIAAVSAIGREWLFMRLAWEKLLNFRL